MCAFHPRCCNLLAQREWRAHQRSKRCASVWKFSQRYEITARNCYSTVGSVKSETLMDATTTFAFEIWSILQLEMTNNALGRAYSTPLCRESDGRNLFVKMLSNGRTGARAKICFTVQLQCPTEDTHPSTDCSFWVGKLAKLRHLTGGVWNF